MRVGEDKQLKVISKRLLVSVLFVLLLCVSAHVFSVDRAIQDDFIEKNLHEHQHETRINQALSHVKKQVKSEIKSQAPNESQGQFRDQGQSQHQSLKGIIVREPIDAQKTHRPPRFVAIIMDDLGNDFPMAKQLIAMPYALTYSFLPHTHYVEALTKLARKKNKEIMLHLPMQPISNKSMGRGGLTEHMQQPQFVDILRQDIIAIPGATGVNNHMGSLLTQNHLQMRWLMAELKSNNKFYFVDSRTHAASVAAQQAKNYRVPTASRDIFLDHVVERPAIDFQFARLLKRINSVGYALAIGHPHRETIEALNTWLPRLQAKGITIVTVSRYIIMIETRERELLRQASLSGSQKMVKN